MWTLRDEPPTTRSSVDNDALKASIMNRKNQFTRVLRQIRIRKVVLGFEKRCEEWRGSEEGDHSNDPILGIADARYKSWNEKILIGPTCSHSRDHEILRCSTSKLKDRPAERKVDARE